MIDRIKSVVVGHAVADALGVPVEFCSRDELEMNPITDMTGFGTYPYPEGSWSDDTSMSLCTLDSLAKKGFVDYKDIMNNFIKWLSNNEYTPTGEAFDIGRTCLKSIIIYSQTNDIKTCGRASEHSNGNGSLMRIHPVALYLYTRNDLSVEQKIEIIHSVSALTHAHERSKIACGIYAFVLWNILDKKDKFQAIRGGLSKARRFYGGKSKELTYYSKLFRRIGQLDRHYEDVDTFRPATVEDIESSGYVVHTLEAAIFCLLHSKSYEDCVLRAINLGDDTDTVGAVAGGLAGALYGYEAIPQKWLKVLKRKDYIEDMCERAAHSWKLTNVSLE